MTTEELKDLVVKLSTEVRILSFKIDAQNSHMDSLTESNGKLAAALHEHEKRFAYSEGRSLALAGVVAAVMSFFGHVVKSVFDRG